MLSHWNDTTLYQNASGPQDGSDREHAPPSPTNVGETETAQHVHKASGLQEDEAECATREQFNTVVKQMVEKLEHNFARMYCSQTNMFKSTKQAPEKGGGSNAPLGP